MGTIDWAGRVTAYPPAAVAEYRRAGLWGTRPIAAEFRAVAGRAPGQRVVLQTGNRLLSVVAWYGLLKAGLIPVCALTAHRAHEIGAISRKTGAVAHLVEAGTGHFDLAAFAREQRAGHPTLRYVLTLGAPAPGSTAAGDSTTPAGPDEARVEDLIERADAAVARKVVDAIQARIGPDEVAACQLSGGT